MLDSSNSLGDAVNYVNGFNWEGWGTGLASGAASFGSVPGANTGPPSSACF